MASSNRLVVEVVGDTTKLTRSLNQAQQQLNRFAGRSQIGAKGSAAADKYIDGLHEIRDGYDDLAKKAPEVQQRADVLNTRMQGFALKAGIAGLAVNRFGANLQELGGNAAKLGTALSDLSSGNIVGFAHALGTVNAANPAKIAKDLLAEGDAAKATAQANAFAAAGFKDLAAAAQSAAEQLQAATAAAAEANLAINILLASGKEAAAFGEAGSIFGRGPGSISKSNALEVASGGFVKGIPTATQRAGVSQTQRNTFFDNKISRELDRVQDLVLSAQVSRLQEIKKEIQARLAKTKDPTRRLTLDDEIVAIDREIKSVNEEIKNGLKKTAKTLKPVGKKIADTFKQQADDIKSALLDAFDSKTDRIDNARALADAKKTLANVRQLGGPDSIKLAQQGVFDAQRAILRQRIVDSRVSVAEGPRGPVNAVSVGNITFNIATSDPDKVAAAVLKKLQLNNRHGSPQGRGRAPGAWTGLH